VIAVVVGGVGEFDIDTSSSCQPCTGFIILHFNIFFLNSIKIKKKSFIFFVVVVVVVIK
jgi:hypothetical protein